ncbi:MAG: hypothetical protein PHC94_14195 [Methylobacter sp.]|nr:hypothetical protein [Methylococcales bacterium]MDD5115163.1 hypothetical protein [Methylobacter sp.]
MNNKFNFCKLYTKTQSKQDYYLLCQLAYPTFQAQECSPSIANSLKTSLQKTSGSPVGAVSSADNPVIGRKIIGLH